jgi:hypothetical protein
MRCAVPASKMGWPHCWQVVGGRSSRTAHQPNAPQSAVFRERDPSLATLLAQRDTERAMSEENVEIVRQLSELWEGGDWGGGREFFDDSCEVVFQHFAFSGRGCVRRRP